MNINLSFIVLFLKIHDLKRGILVINTFSLSLSLSLSSKSLIDMSKIYCLGEWGKVILTEKQQKLGECFSGWFRLKIKNFWGWGNRKYTPPPPSLSILFLKVFFQGRFLSRRWVYLSWNFENLHCTGEPYRFIGQQDPSVHTDRHKSYYFYIKIRLARITIMKMNSAEIIFF